MKFLSLFTGIGGFDSGFEAAGMTNGAMCEIDRWATMVLRYHWPDVEILPDVKEIRKSTLSFRPEVICGGFPCQDLSVAGKRKGMAGKRSGLWFEFRRIIEEFKPGWVVVENVPGLLSSNERRDFAVLLRGLRELGYVGEYKTLDSQYFGVAQRRRRVFIVGYLGAGSRPEILFEREGLRRNPAESRKVGEGTSFDVVNCLEASSSVDRGDTGHNSKLIAFCHRDNGRDATENLSPTLRCFNPASEGVNQPVGGMAVCFQQNTRDEVRKVNGDGDLAGCQAAEPGMKQQNYLAFNLRGRDGGAMPEVTDKESVRAASGGSSKTYVCLNPEDPQTKRIHTGEVAPTLSGSDGNGGQRTPYHLMPNMAVRRLTPRECERLQGFPDDWTRWGRTEDGKIVEISDTQRYKMLGNAVTRTVGEWIGQRITKAAADRKRCCRNCV